MLLYIYIRSLHLINYFFLLSVKTHMLIIILCEELINVRSENQNKTCVCPNCVSHTGLCKPIEVKLVITRSTRVTPSFVGRGQSQNTVD